MDAKSGNGSGGNFVWGVIAGLIAILGAGGLYLSGVFTGNPTPDQPPQEQAVADADMVQQPTDGATSQSTADQPVAESGGASDVETDTASGEDAAAEIAPTSVAPPVLDQIFVETDGNALLSGNAEPGSQVQVLLDGAPLHEFTVDDSGQFAEFVSIPFSDDAQGLALETSDGDQSARSDDYLIAALPKPAEDQIASADVPAESAEAPADSAKQATDSGETAAQPEGAAESQVAEAPTEDTDEDRQIAVLRSGEEGVELVQSPSVQSEAPEQIELDTIGYSDAGDVQLTGRVSEGSAVRLYLNNRLVTDLTPTDDGNWRGEIEGIDPGVYTLRVDEVNTDGTVLSRVETPFKREPVEILQSAEAATADQASDETPPIRSVTVQKGDTLWAISRDRFGDGVLYVKLFDANRKLIRDPDLIYPGQIFTIPE
ncbi:LysM peptidoglycan-binding domain-containing protein [Rhodobacteraceae bacterium B1Z28]|uniref:LysM peptidoglycan-binding domain-containing protein n=1 Tax=Ruegeria haliotis TaxID=2747601 RepID=A0ABX2PPU0_9RHOB|nr:LysM peptidoglycan-binding domain-containing protein [Ruegeria haliotis]NVO55696.1 LysM peptidoglycan-binding domain-containing protein [Ruegeria haliotis]